MIKARIIADSVNPAGRRLTTFVLTYPRFIHAEFMTHRVFSRNAASSRAIPLQKMIEAVTRDPALPERWVSEKPGMQGGDEIANVKDAVWQWQIAREDSIHRVQKLRYLGVHKSLSNRLLEPFGHITVIATASDEGLANFLALRAHPAAEPSFQVLAYRMLAAYMASAPAPMQWGDWHIPRFEGAPDPVVTIATKGVEVALAVSTARCARISFLTFDGDHDETKDIALHDRLAESGHWSPFEHCAKATDFNFNDERYHWSNFDGEEPSGWMQYRKNFTNENVRKVDLAALLAAKPAWITA